MISLFLMAVVAQIKKLDTEAFTPLHPHIGRIIQLDVELPFSGLQSSYLLIKKDNLIAISPVNSPASDFTLAGKLFNFGYFALDCLQKNMDSKQNEWIKLLHRHQLQCYGDMAVLQAFQEALRNIDLDWSTLWAKGVGEKLAFPITRLLKKNKERVSMAVKNSIHALKEYVFYETNYFASSVEVENWIEQTRSLRNDTERLEKNLILLKNRFEKLT